MIQASNSELCSFSLDLLIWGAFLEEALGADLSISILQVDMFPLISPKFHSIDFGPPPTLFTTLKYLKLLFSLSNVGIFLSILIPALISMCLQSHCQLTQQAECDEWERFAELPWKHP